jgi:hypothetical protein
MLKLKKVHTDDRGFIYTLKSPMLTCEEITILLTKAGYARGGCIHRLHDETCVVIEGTITYFSLSPEYKDFSFTIMHAGSSRVTSKGSPHYFVSDTDSVVMEFGANSDEKDNKYYYFKEIVDDLNGRRKEKI